MRAHSRALNDVIRDPDTDPPRLAYAAACEKLGDLDRAHFIRLQMAAVEKMRGGQDDWWEPSSAARDLLRKSGKSAAWAGPLPSSVREYEFYRGFVENIELDAGAFLRDAEELFRIAPIRRLRLTNVLPVMDELFNSPHLARIVSLSLDFQGIGDDGLKALASSPHVQKLAWLNLRQNNITSTGLEALAASMNLPGLQYVNFFGNPVELEATERVGEENGQVVWIEVGLTEIEKHHGRKVWLHSVEDHGYRNVFEAEF